MRHPQNFLVENGDWKPVENPIFNGPEGEEFKDAIARAGYADHPLMTVGEKDYGLNSMRLYAPAEMGAEPQFPYLVDFTTNDQSHFFYFFSFKEAVTFFRDYSVIFSAIAASETADCASDAEMYHLRDEGGRWIMADGEIRREPKREGASKGKATIS